MNNMAWLYGALLSASDAPLPLWEAWWLIGFGVVVIAACLYLMFWG